MTNLLIENQANLEKIETQGEIAIKIRSLTFNYPEGDKVLKGVNLEIVKGEYIALVGANGAGKTTLCLFLNGIIPNVIGGKISGEVRVLGMNPFKMHVYDVAQGVGLVLQDPESQLFSADVVSEVAFAAENRGIDPNIIMARMDDVLKIVRLEGLMDRMSDELSGGQKQRLAIASNLIVRPEILVADEPTSQLDPIGKEEVFATLQTLNHEHNMTVIIASHDVDQIVRYADRVIVLDKGEIILAGSPAQVFREVEKLDRISVHVPALARLGSMLRFNHGSQPLSLEVDKAAAQISEWLDDPSPVEIKLSDIPPSKRLTKVDPGRGGLAAKENAALKSAVDVKDISFAYPGMADPAIHDISFTIPQGQFVAIIGQNGAGKTTLMKCMVGLLKPSRGEIKLSGELISHKTIKEIAQQIGLILQNPDTQLFRMSIEEEIQFGLTKLGLSEDEIKARVEEALKITGFLDRRDVYPFTLSLGDRRKVAVASIVAMRPSILILDEPLTGQDYKGRYELCNLAETLHQAGHTILMITHDMELVAEYAERTLVMGNGTLLLDAPTTEVFENIDILRSTFIEPPEIITLTQALRSKNIPGGLLTVEEVAETLVRQKLQTQSQLSAKAGLR